MNRNTDLYRQLVTLARASHIAAGQFHDSLIASGLQMSRASELKRILKTDEVAAEFTLVDPDKCISFGETLTKARRTAP